jgi:hypothetical protein
MAIVHSSCILDPQTRERALARIGYFDDTKLRGRQVDYRRLLGWFVELSRKTLATMGPTKLRELYDEVRALQEEGLGDVKLTMNEADTKTQVPKTQATVAAYLKQLTTTGRLEFEAFTLSPSIMLPRFLPGSKLPYSIITGKYVEPLHGKGLLYLFFEALEGAGDRLRQCPYCATLFVQVRRKQRFCTRQHQAIVAMRDLRARRQKEREAKKTKRQRDAQPKRVAHIRKKGGTPHGKQQR